jgi:hypothetical protein
MKIIETMEAIQQMPDALHRTADEVRQTREQLHMELKATRVLAEKAFLAIMRELEGISKKLDNEED